MSKLLFGSALTVASYLLGSVCFGPLVAKRRGVDLRSVGSGNVGATNVERMLGKRAGYTVLALDAAKGLAAAGIGKLVFGGLSPWITAIGLAVVVGHLWPAWFGFRGGKGAATAAGVMLAASPVCGAVGFGFFFLVKYLTRRASIGSLTALVVTAGLAYLLHGFAPITWLAWGLGGLVLARHSDNICRLVRGEEPPT